MYPGPCSVYWYSGLFLQPQHLQLMDLHQQWLSEEYIRLRFPWHYGIWEWSLNEHVLKTGGILFEKLSVILPGGTLLKFPENCAIKKRNISADWKNKDRPLAIWLMIRSFAPREANVTADETVAEGQSSRWMTVTQEREMPDVYQKDAPGAAVTCLKYAACLMTDEEKKEAIDFEGILLMRLCMRGGEIVVDETCSPPALTLTGTPVLSRWIHNSHAQIAALTARVSVLCHEGRPYRHYDRLTLQMLKLTLVRTLSVLSRYLQTPQVSPWHWFCQLEQCRAELLSLEPVSSGVMPDTEPYDHAAPLPGLTSLQSAIMRWGTELNRPGGQRIVFSPAPGGGDRWVADVSALTERCVSTVWLSLGFSGMDSDPYRAPVSQVKLAAESRIDSIVQYSLRGVGLWPDAGGPAGEIRPPDTVYCQTDLKDDRWKELLRTGRAVVYWPGAPEDAAVSLITETDDEHPD
ncbi:type VI secretion system baseplate subunit TssK [Salmonella enterica]